MNPLHCGPNDGQTTSFGRERINLISTLSHVAKKALNRIGATNVTMHDRGKRIKGQQMLFIFTEAADGLWVALLIFGFEGCEIEQRVVFLLLLEDPVQFCCHLLALTMR